MENKLQILVVYDDRLDPVVSLLENEQNYLIHKIALISIREFIESIQVNDRLNINGVNIEWSLKNKDGLSQLWTNHNTYLVNRCHDFKATCDNLFILMIENTLGMNLVLTSILLFLLLNTGYNL